MLEETALLSDDVWIGLYSHLYCTRAVGGRE